MAFTADSVTSHRPAAWATLPARLRLLCVSESPATVRWLEEAFASDSATEVYLVAAIGVNAAATRLRDELFDAILIAHQPGRLDAMELTAGLRTGGAEEPIVILGREQDEELLAVAYESGADAYLGLQNTTVRGLLWTLSRGLDRHRQSRENRRLSQLDRTRTEQDQRETQHLLLQQRAIVGELESLRDRGLIAGKSSVRRHSAAASTDDGTCAELPAELVDGYRELLRAYVIMGAGNLASDLDRFAESLAHSGFSAHQALRLHLASVEELMQGLRTRGTRHVMNRADLLILEVMLHLAECYRRRYDGERK